MSFNLGVAIGQSGTIADLDRKVASLRRALAERDAEIQRLTDLLEENSNQLALHRAHAAALEVVIQEYQRQHSDSPLLRASGQHYRDAGARGEAKTVGRLFYERAFDTKAAELGIENPASRRTD